ncbi:3',5'-cyclic adenosine monophosphate phosphodiesterase CpdA [Anatilimnocola aggregata]|uniref:3',5'-cyclic adenosine monophosphate phosphodiesterase CpdA n=1 Tax=Anatilimnocola aggregata TaxID=2528021 RepID=A0A517YDP1_9BACT|nr:metallophosphoesterase [Anatilimnocola aggregata]QDU28357.1 3',5'-cyclic adenosine monophosphate phosphodiesterase CpdA [Anatilimnocola aggregata]
MTFHILPADQPLASRRRFFAWAGLTAAVIAANRLPGEEIAKSATTRIALLSDTHISADKELLSRGVNMTDHLTQAWQQVNEAAGRLSSAIVHGDVAFLKGEMGDYGQVAQLLVPAGKSAVPLHFLLGNHDDRANFRESLKSAAASPLESHHVSILELKQANWFMLDSLEKVNSTPGKLGTAQLEWLAAALDAKADKPAIISVHHHPQKEGDKVAGIQDTKELFDILVPRKHVKILFYGHTHAWGQKVQDGIHLVNLPPVAYVFAKEKPSGWVEAAVGDKGIELTLHGVGPANEAHGKKLELAWR